MSEPKDKPKTEEKKTGQRTAPLIKVGRGSIACETRIKCPKAW
jgi:hypothetical protein